MKDAAVHRLAKSITQLTLCQVTTSEVDDATKLLEKACQKLQGIQNIPSQRVTDLEAAIQATRWLSWYGVGLASADRLPVVDRIPAGPIGSLKVRPAERQRAPTTKKDLEAAIRQLRQIGCILDSCTISASYEVTQAQKAILLLDHTAKGASTSSEELNAQISPRTDDEHNLPYHEDNLQEH